MTDIRIKRIYEDAAESDGYRALVDRLWPRGVSKDRAQLNEWAKDLSPTDDMRKEFGHDEDAWPHFRKAYRQHLTAEACQERMRELLEAAGDGALTLLFAAKNEERNNAVVLKDALEDMKSP